MNAIQNPFALSLSKGLPFWLRRKRAGLRQAQPERWFSSFILIVCALVAAPAAAQTFPQLTGRVVDQANIIPDDREAALTLQLEQLQRATSRQLVVATVASLEGHEIADYGYRLGRHWGIGQSEANNGIILLVAPNERRVRIEVGYGLEGIVTDALSSRIINEQIVPRFRENDYPGGIEVGTAALVSQLAAPPEQAEQRAIEAERARERSRGDGDGGGGFVVFALLLVIGLPILLGLLGGRRRRRPSPWGRAYGRRDDHDDGMGWVVAGAVLDALLSGRGGGGSSWGGGGSSWGGGGGGFSGGGGSFGGGGASGSW